MINLQPGLLVNVVMADGVTLRPFMVIAITNAVTGVITGQLFSTPGDISNIPFILPTGGLAVTSKAGNPISASAVSNTKPSVVQTFSIVPKDNSAFGVFGFGVTHDAAGKTAGSWNFIPISNS